MASSGARLKIAPLIILLISLALNLGAFVAAASEYGYDKALYDNSCRRYRVCWPALYTVWAIAIAFGVTLFVASFALIVLHYRDHRLRNRLTTAFLVISIAMWLTVIVMGWVPLNIPLYAGVNGLPAWSSSGNSYSTQIKFSGTKPLAGMFHYALAFYRTAVLRKPSGSGAFRSVSDHGNSAMASVVLCNMVFGWSVLAIIPWFIHLRRAGTVQVAAGHSDKHRLDSV